MLSPETPVSASAIRTWEREVEREKAAVVAARGRLVFAETYLAQLRHQHALQQRDEATR